MKIEELVCNYLYDVPEDFIRIDWYGGEPLLAIDTIDRISTYLINKKINFTAGMVTNGYLLTPENVDVLVKCNSSLNN